MVNRQAVVTGTQYLNFPITGSCGMWPESGQCRISLLLERSIFEVNGMKSVFPITSQLLFLLAHA
ncbi:hypothetical protein ALO67_200118 [Pseudomonas amygdali pv. hibisci]|uniref:Uncharacterized protein n=1 Tax=Pseudomonas amygdali pv. hibisci TaxID=251723 RepID=A0AB34U7H4_PSEA0|nr:hypothetical protein ALO67_200118 [Pseudomonas amygdali pv. hibisci]